MPFTTDAVIFVSHFDVKPGHLHFVKAMWDSIVIDLERAKPRTVAYLGFQNDGGGSLTIVQVFPDSDAMAAHLNGPDERTRAAYEHIEPAGWEVYGPAPEEILAQLGESALAAGVDLMIQPRGLGGYLRTTVR
jgi:hypothetical protein